jgi:protein-tyrosine phosphatase
MKKVLFICTGNTCRSPMAEAIFNKMLQNRELSSHEIKSTSAGLYALDNAEATPQAIEVMRNVGIDLSQHRSRSVDEKMLQEVDLILTMTRHHCHQLQESFPHVQHKVYTLAEYAGLPEEDVSDPYGQDTEAYRSARQQIESFLKRIINQGDIFS